MKAQVYAGKVLLVAITLYGIHRASSTVKNVFPPSGSIIAGLPGRDSFSSYTFQCDAFREDSQVPTIWTLRSDGEINIKVLRQSAYEGIIVITGTHRPQPSSSITFRNMLKIVNFTERFDRATLACGLEGELEGANFNLRIYRAPQLSEGRRQAIVEGSNVSVNLLQNNITREFPFPQEFQWSKQGQLVPRRNTSTQTFGYPSAHFSDISREDAGNYTLTATNYRLDNTNIEVGSAMGSVFLDVLYGPDIVRGPETAIGAVGTSVTLLCGTGLVSNPAAIITWSDASGHTVTSGRSITVHTDPSSVNLTLSQVSERNGGSWTCTIEVPGVRTIHHSITLTVVVPPSPPEDVTITSFGPTWAILEWRLPLSMGLPPSSTKLYTVTVISCGDDQSTSRNSTAGLSMNVTGLLPNTRYRFTVRAETVFEDIRAVGGESAQESVITNMTVPDVDCLRSPVSADGRIDIFWSYRHTGGLNISQVSLSYAARNLGACLPQGLLKLPGSNEELQDGYETIDDRMSTNQSVEGLTAGKCYTFRVVTSNRVGSSSTTCPPVSHEIGIPQMPVLSRATSSGGGVTLEVFTNESGTQEPLDLFQFNVRAQHNLTLEVKSFTVKRRGYVDGEIASLVLTGFSESEEEPLYMFTVSCTNEFGTSEESNEVAVLIQFKGGADKGAIAGGTITLIVVMSVVMVLSVISIIYIYKRHKKNSGKLTQQTPLNWSSNHYTENNKTSDPIAEGVVIIPPLPCTNNPCSPDTASVASVLQTDSESPYSLAPETSSDNDSHQERLEAKPAATSMTVQAPLSVRETLPAINKLHPLTVQAAAPQLSLNSSNKPHPLTVRAAAPQLSLNSSNKPHPLTIRAAAPQQSLNSSNKPHPLRVQAVVPPTSLTELSPDIDEPLPLVSQMVAVDIDEPHPSITPPEHKSPRQMLHNRLLQHPNSPLISRSEWSLHHSHSRILTRNTASLSPSTQSHYNQNRQFLSISSGELSFSKTQCINSAMPPNGRLDTENASSTSLRSFAEETTQPISINRDLLELEERQFSRSEPLKRKIAAAPPTHKHLLDDSGRHKEPRKPSSSTVSSSSHTLL